MPINDLPASARFTRFLFEANGCIVVFPKHGFSS